MYYLNPNQSVHGVGMYLHGIEGARTRKSPIVTDSVQNILGMHTPTRGPGGAPKKIMS